MSVQAIAWALEQRVGSHTAKLVLLSLANRTGYEETCFPSIAVIAKDAELSNRAVRYALDYLEERGLVQKIPRVRENGSTTSNLYSLPVGGVQQVQGGVQGVQGPLQLCASPKPSVNHQLTKKVSIEAWTPNEHDLDYARTNGVLDIAREIEHFRMHHTERGTLSPRWDLRWRTWVINSRKFSKAGSVRRETPMQAAMRKIRDGTFGQNESNELRGDFGGLLPDRRSS